MCEVKSPLPTPRFFTQKSFSCKKDKTTQSRERPPPTPKQKYYGSCSSLSRLVSSTEENTDQAHSISFQKSKPSLSSKYDSKSDKLYFHQCFEVISKIGSGSFGEVFKVRCKEDGKYYAIKRARDEFSGKSDRERKLQEVQKHEQLPSHPNCVRFYRAWEEKQKLYIQTELCNCSLSQYADKNHDIPEDVVWNCLIDLLSALKHLHNHNLIHLDIKPENIFLSKEGVCKLGDFGLVLDLSKSDTTDAIEGDPRYLAPELMQGIFSKAADIFSLGITILELASDMDLPPGDEAWHQLRQLEIPKEFLKGLSLELTEVICLMMEPDHTKRPSVEDIFQIEAVDRVHRKRKRIDNSPVKMRNITSSNGSHSTSSEWNSSMSDEVFDKGPVPNNSSLSSSHDENHSVSQDLSFTDVENNRFNFSRAIRLGMSTPCGFRYWDSKLHETSGSPSLSSSRKKGLSPASDCCKLKKSPRLQLFNDISSEEDNILSIPPKNLLDVFNSLASSEDSP